MIGRLFAGALALLASCQPTVPARPWLIGASRPPQTIYVGEDYHTMFDARPGDTIIVVMDPTGFPLDRCNHMAGELIYNPFTLIYTCEGVDF